MEIRRYRADEDWAKVGTQTDEIECISGTPWRKQENGQQGNEEKENNKMATTKINERIFDFAYGCAMGDAVQRNAYPHHSHLEKQKDGKRKKVSDEGFGEYIPTPKNELGSLSAPKAEVKCFVDRILFGENFKDFDDYMTFFLETAEKVNIAFTNKNGVEEFTFGNIQKLLNMTLKHIYICTYPNDALKGKFKFCHCPIDSQISKHLVQIELRYRGKKDSRFNNDGRPLKNKLTKEEKNIFNDNLISYIQGISCSSGTTWSNMSFKEDIACYDKIQRKIAGIVDNGEGRFGNNPLEFDYFVWQFADFDFT